VAGVTADVSLPWSAKQSPTSGLALQSRSARWRSVAVPYAERPAASGTGSEGC
jgi:hypothetical protein